jgi:cardiolipin synthase
MLKKLYRLATLATPTLITSTRLLALYPYWVNVRDPQRHFEAALWLALIGATDFLDGFAARSLKAVTTIGKIIDPTADRLVLLFTAYSFWIYRILPSYLIAFIVLREVFVALITLSEFTVLQRRVDVVRVGKAGTFGLLMALPIALAFDRNPFVYRSTVIVIALSTALLYIALFDYIRDFRQQLRLHRS